MGHEQRGACSQASRRKLPCLDLRTIGGIVGFRPLGGMVEQFTDAWLYR